MIKLRHRRYAKRLVYGELSSLEEPMKNVSCNQGCARLMIREPNLIRL